jgi:hypothetical protein
MKTLEIRRIFGGNCVLSCGHDPPVKVASVNELKAKLREFGVPEQRIHQVLLELKDSRRLTIPLQV